MKVHKSFKPCRIKVFPKTGHAMIYLHGKRGGIALCSASDVAIIKNCSWVENHRGYVCRRRPRPGEGVEFMHRLLKGAVKGDTIDHANRNTKDNRQENLRFSDQYSNSFNAHKWGAGVGVMARNGKWHACICVEQKYHWLGSFKTKSEAIAARKKAELKFWGEIKPRHKNDRVKLKGF